MGEGVPLSGAIQKRRHVAALCEGQGRRSFCFAENCLHRDPGCGVAGSFNPKGYSKTVRPQIEIEWKDLKLRKDCASEKRGRRRFGDQHWRMLKRRLVSLESATSLAQLEGVPGRCHPLRADRKGQFAIGLWKGYRLVFEPNNDPLPKTGSGELDRKQVTRILISEVVDYHDG